MNGDLKGMKNVERVCGLRDGAREELDEDLQIIGIESVRWVCV